jgi:hypothetical protein
LRELDALRAAGAISEAVYEAKRDQIIADMTTAGPGTGPTATPVDPTAPHAAEPGVILTHMVATVVMVPLGAMRRIRLLPLSAM